MIRTSTRALGLDALYQVLDNGVFRILAAAAVIPVLIFTVVQVTADELSILWGVWSWPIDAVAPVFGASEGTVNLQAAVLGRLLDWVFFALAGSFGVLFVLAATAFFVPRMLEKGAADVLFHKPVSRLRFFLSRYAAGLMFVFLLALVSATGVFLALVAFSGFTDIGVFAIVPALTYLFGLVFPVTMLTGVLTRSTVASILLSSVFFMGNGCIHGFWIQREIGAFSAFDELEAAADARDKAEEEAAAAALAANGEVVEEIAAAAPIEDEVPEDEPSKWRHWWTVLDVVHFALPKTSAVPHLTAKLRKAALRQAWVHTGSTLQLGRLPDGWSRVSEDELGDAAAQFPALAASELAGTPAVAARSEDGDLMLLFLRPKREIERRRPGGSVRLREERLGDAKEALLEALQSAAGVEAPEEIEFERLSRLQFGPNSKAEEEADKPTLSLGPGFFAAVLSWREPARQEAPRVRALVFKNGDEVGTLLHRSPSEDPIDTGFQNIVAKLGHGDQDSAYGKLLRFDAGPRTNILQSVGSSLAFVLLLMALGAWRLSRIDF